MSVFAAVGVYNRDSDWLIAVASLFIAYIIMYPLFILFVRYRHMYRIKKQMVTSLYSLPVKMSPTELAYIFSTKVKKQQLYGTLLDLANRSVIVLHKKGEHILVERGPKVDNNLALYEKLLISNVLIDTESRRADLIMEGTVTYNYSEKYIEGSKQYVFWWLLRETLRNRKIIQRDLSKRYFSMLFVFGVVGSFFVIILSILAFRISQMVHNGEVSIDTLSDNFVNGITIWLIFIIPMIIISFGLFKFRGRMLGRDWIMTAKYRRYLGQMDAFREFVRLTHRDKLRFESKELKKEAIALTRPYAIACGYIKK